MSTPQSTIYVCSGVRLDSRYNHTIYFDSRVEQRAYFMGKVVKQFSTYSYIRRNWAIKLQATMEQAKTWNYLFFHNGESGKWYYYFINSIEYVNDNTVELSLEMDVMQTYLPTTGSEALDYRLLPCFIERQHTESDEVGEHTLDEGLELGEITINGSFEAVKFSDSGSYLGSLTDLCILIMATVDPSTGESVEGTYMNNVYSGLGIFAVSVDYHAKLSTLLSNLAENTDAIVNMWMYPQCLIELASGEDWTDSDNIIHPVESVQEFEFTVDKKMDIDGYTPINKKLYTYPFNFLYCTDNNGNAGVFHYERFSTDDCQFGVSGAISPDGGAHLSPLYYNGEPWNWEAGITLNSYPSCAWNADVYKIWLAQNQNQHGLSTAMSGLSIAGGAVASIGSLATGNILGAGAGVGAMVSGASSIANLVAQKKDMELQPPQARGTHSASVNVANSRNRFDFYFKSVKAEVAKVIDDYFSMYGYRINRVQTPRINVRNHYTYIKTIDCHIQGALCNEDIVKIESIFDKGITFWKRGDEVAEYGLANTNIPV